MKRAIEKADILIEALPYIKKFQHRIMVVKCGGRQLINDENINNILKDIAFMNCVGLNPVLVHGGGPSISEKLRKLGHIVEFRHGQRVTDAKTLAVVVEELNMLNREMVKKINSFGVKARGLSGNSGKLIKAMKFSSGVDIGFVGEVAAIRKEVVKKLLKRNYVPVISPLGIGSDGQLYNINADVVAAEIAAALGAWKLVLLTDVQGILRNPSDKSSLISTLKMAQVEDLVKKGIITEGMIPKVGACTAALKKGVKKTHIIDGSIPRSLLLEIFTDQGVGTQIIK
ncbi:MAG: acetylglutamate kinase [Candidatus Omnitrophota bacterium]